MEQKTQKNRTSQDTQKTQGNPCALITGASSGLGSEFARLFAKDGWDVILVARSEEKLTAHKKELETAYGIRAFVFPADLTDPLAPQTLYDKAAAAGLTISALVNNAGFGDFGAYADCDMQKQEQMVAVNILSLLRLTRLFLPKMLGKNSGKILNVASIASFEPGPLMSVYYATKAFVLSFTEALSEETKNTGVTVTALCPGPTKTGFEAGAALENSGLFKNLKVATAAETAAYGYRKMKKGCTIAIHGSTNRLIVHSVRFAPRRLVRHMVWRIQK